MKPWDEGGLKDKSKELSSSLCKLTAQRGEKGTLDMPITRYMSFRVQRSKTESSDEEWFDFRVVKTRVRHGGKRHQEVLEVLQEWISKSSYWKNVQSHRETRTKEHLLGGFIGAIGGEEDVKRSRQTCLVAQAPSEVCSKSSYFSDENSSIAELARTMI
ncbi:hypothetical protein Tco_1025590 [Tanacetum coccineum]